MTMKKNNEEIMERLLKARKLSDEELEKVSGGATYESATGTYKISCSTPGCMFNSDIEPTCWDPNWLVCPFCKTGTISYIFTPYGEGK